MWPAKIGLDLPRKCLVLGAATGASTQAAGAGRKAHRTTLGSRCCGYGRTHPLGPRTSRQNDGHRHPGRSAERHVRCARHLQATCRGTALAPARAGSEEIHLDVHCRLLKDRDLPLRESGQLVQDKGASHRNVEGLTNTQHGDLYNLIEVGPHFRWKPRVFVAEQYHALPCCLTYLLE